MKTAIPLLLIATLQTACAQHEPRSSASLIAQIRGHHEGIAIWWVGNDGWLIKAGNLLISTDLDLETEQKIEAPPITAEQLAPELDLALVTHHHGDHCNVPTIKALAEAGRCTFVLPRPCTKELTGLQLPASRVVVPEPGHPFDSQGVGVQPLHAVHGAEDSTIYTREPDFVESITHNCGYVLNIGGKRFLQPGDSVLTDEHLDLANIDVLFVSPTVHNTHIDRSVLLITRLRPRYIFPQHFGTYQVTDENAFWTRGYPDELQSRLPKSLRERYHKPKLGQMFVIR